MSKEKAESFVRRFCETYGDNVRAVQKDGYYQLMHGEGSSTRSFHVDDKRIRRADEYARIIASHLGLPKRPLF